MTYELTVTDQTSAFDQAFEALNSSLVDQTLVSQDRCVDSLLDLLNAAPSIIVRNLITDILDDIRHVSSVRVDWLEGELRVLSAAVAVETGTFSWR